MLQDGTRVTLLAYADDVAIVANSHALLHLGSKMADSFFVDERAIHADESFSSSVSSSHTTVSGVPAFCEATNIPEMASEFQAPLLASSASHIGSASSVRSDSPSQVDQAAPIEPVLVLPFPEGLVLDTSSRPWILRGPISDLAAPISAFTSFGFVVSGFGPVPGSSTIFESQITPVTVFCFAAHFTRR